MLLSLAVFEIFETKRLLLVIVDCMLLILNNVVNVNINSGMRRSERITTLHEPYKYVV